MKFIFSVLCYCIVFQIQAREIVVINYAHDRRAEADFVAATLIHQLALPNKFLSLQEGPCSHQEYAVAIICIQDNGDIEVKQVKVEVMQKLLKAFGETL